MKFFAVFALIVAAASAAVLPSQTAQIEAIVAAIQSPSTNPATAALLEQQLADLIGVVVPSPAIIDTIDNADISPAIVAESAVDAVAVVDQAESVAPVAPVVTPVSPVVTPVAPAPAASSPLVQVILNINAPAGAVDASPVVTPVAPVVTPVVESSVDAVSVAEQAVDAVSVAEQSVDAVSVAEQTVDAVNVAEESLIIPEPVIVGVITPVSPAVNLPEILN